MRFAIVSACCSAALLYSFSAVAGDTLANIQDSKTLNIGYMATAPFAFKDDSGKVNGFSIALCQKVAEAIKSELKINNLNIRYQEVDSNARFTELLGGKIDLECGSTTANLERSQRVGFTIPHFYSGVRMLVRRNSNIKNWSDLKSKTVVVLTGSTTIKLIHDRNNLRNLGVKSLEGKDVAESFSLLENGKADAFSLDDVLLFNLRATAKNPDEYVVVGDALSVEPYSIMFRKDDPRLKKLVDTEITRLMQNGDFVKMYNYWFTQPNGPKGTNLKMPIGYLLSDSIRFPSDKLNN